MTVYSWHQETSKGKLQVLSFPAALQEQPKGAVQFHEFP